MTIALVANQPGFNAVKKQYKKTYKSAMLTAIEKSGGVIYLQVHGPSLSVMGIDGNSRAQYNGNGTIHEIHYDEVEADKVSPYLVQSILEYLKAIESGSNNFEMVYKKGSTSKIRKFDIYTKDTIVEAYRAGIVGSKAAGSGIKVSQR